MQLKFYFTFDIVKSNIFARLHNFPPLVDKSHPDSEVEDDVKKEINENLKLKMISRMNSISTKMSLTIDDLRLDVLQSAVILKNYQLQSLVILVNGHLVQLQVINYKA